MAEGSHLSANDVAKAVLVLGVSVHAVQVRARAVTSLCVWVRYEFGLPVPHVVDPFSSRF